MDGYHRSSKSTCGANKLIGTNIGCRDIFPVDSGADDLFNCCQCLGRMYWAPGGGIRCYRFISLHPAR